MSKWTVVTTNHDGHTTVTVVSAAGVGQDSDFLTFVSESGTVVASFPVVRVISVIKIKKNKPPKAPQVPAVSRKHPVYTYGKGDLVEALCRAVDLTTRGGQNNTNYLRDIIRDLQKGS